jgi:hypothetical protein
MKIQKSNIARLLLVAASLCGIVKADCDPCLLDGSEVTDDCVVYANLQGDLVAFAYASQACREKYQIESAAVQPEDVCATSNGFVDSLRNGRLEFHPIKFMLGVSEMGQDGFFSRDASNNNRPVILDTITIEGETYTNCTTAEIPCYDAMKQFYFVESNPDGKAEMEAACEELERLIVVEQEAMQGRARGEICTAYNLGFEGFNIYPECGVLNDQVKAERDSRPGIECGPFNNGPGDLQIPDDCDDNGSNGDGDKDGSDDSGGAGGGSSAFSLRLASEVVLGLLLWLL